VGRIVYPKEDLSVSAVDLSFEFTALSLTEYLVWLQQKDGKWKIKPCTTRLIKSQLAP